MTKVTRSGDESKNKVLAGSSPDSDQRKIGSRVIRSGQYVKINGERGLFKVTFFRGDDVHCYGGKTNYEKSRAFHVDRIGRRPQMNRRDK
jgi:hypothetical protein